MRLLSFSAFLWLNFLNLGVLAENTLSANCLFTIPNLYVISPGSPAYANASQPFNRRLTPSPGYITNPTTVAEVQEIVKCAYDLGLSISAISGGHSYAAYGLSGNIVINLKNLTSINLQSNGLVVSQTGNRLGDVATTIWKEKRALPHGSCPYVGTGGHTLYGGFGYYGRIGGLLLDRVRSAQVVLANGTLVTASESSHSDLFWAIRGGGPSFGIVTEWTYATMPAPPTVINYQITFPSLNNSQITDAYVAWQGFASKAPIPLAMAAVLNLNSNKKLQIAFSGDFYGSRSDFDKDIAPLIAVIPSGASLSATTTNWIGALEIDSGEPNNSLSTNTPDVYDTFFTKSLITTQPSSKASINSWVEYMASQGASSNTSWFTQVDLYGAGGAIQAVPSNATAFANRDAFLVYQLYASSSNSNPPYPKDGIPFVDNMLKALDPNPQAAYPNYIDPTLTKQQWEEQYFGNHVGRLQQLKKEWDSTNVFRFPEGF